MNMPRTKPLERSASHCQLVRLEILDFSSQPARIACTGPQSTKLSAVNCMRPRLIRRCRHFDCDTSLTFGSRFAIPLNLRSSFRLFLLSFGCSFGYVCPPSTSILPCFPQICDNIFLSSANNGTRANEHITSNIWALHHHVEMIASTHYYWTKHFGVNKSLPCCSMSPLHWYALSSHDASIIGQFSAHNSTGCWTLQLVG